MVLKLSSCQFDEIVCFHFTAMFNEEFKCLTANVNFQQIF